MEAQFTWRHDGARALMTLENEEVAVLSFGGPLTAGVAAALRGFAARAHAMAFVLDLRKALLALTLDQMGSYLEGVAVGDLLRQPGAIVARRDQVEILRQHARNVAQVGVLRVVFTEMAPALRWARQEAQLAM